MTVFDSVWKCKTDMLAKIVWQQTKAKINY